MTPVSRPVLRARARHTTLFNPPGKDETTTLVLQGTPCRVAGATTFYGDEFLVQVFWDAVVLFYYEQDDEGVFQERSSISTDWEDYVKATDLEFLSLEEKEEPVEVALPPAPNQG